MHKTVFSFYMYIIYMHILGIYTNTHVYWRVLASLYPSFLEFPVLVCLSRGIPLCASVLQRPAGSTISYLPNYIFLVQVIYKVWRYSLLSADALFVRFEYLCSWIALPKFMNFWSELQMGCELLFLYTCSWILAT